LVRALLSVLVAASTLGLVALAVFPPAAVGLGGALILGGAVTRARGDRTSGFGLAATGAALVLAAVLVLVLVDARQDRPVILGPDIGLTPGG